MAALPLRRSLPYFAGFTLASSAALIYTSSRPSSSHALDSASNPPTSLLSLPRTLLFAQTLTVTHTEQINHDTKRITFALPGGAEQISGVPAGSAILTQHTPSNAWLPVLRPYTPISAPSARGTLELLVKKYPSGAASSHLHSLTPGETLLVRGPLPGYAYNPSPPGRKGEGRELVFIAGGAGITPIYALAKSILEDARDGSRVHLVWGVNGVRDLVLKTELEVLERKFGGRLRVTYCVSGDGEGEVLAEEGRFRRGYVGKEVLGEVLAEVKRGNRLGDERGTKVWLCGPPRMEESLAGKGGILRELGVDKVHRF